MGAVWSVVGGVVAIVGAIVAIVAAVIAGLQARWARKQVEIAERAEADRLVDRHEARPQLKVHAEAIPKFVRTSAGIGIRVEPPEVVEVTMINTSATRAITVDHVGVRVIPGGPTHIFGGGSDENSPCPVKLSPSDAWKWNIDTHVLQGLCAPDVEQPEFVIFASDRPMSDDDAQSDEHQWDSKNFALDWP